MITSNNSTHHHHHHHHHFHCLSLIMNSYHTYYNTSLSYPNASFQTHFHNKYNKSLLYYHSYNHYTSTTQSKNCLYNTLLSSTSPTQDYNHPNSHPYFPKAIQWLFWFWFLSLSIKPTSFSFPMLSSSTVFSTSLCYEHYWSNSKLITKYLSLCLPLLIPSSHILLILLSFPTLSKLDYLSLVP